MFRFGNTSLMRLATADTRLQILAQAVMDKQLMDFSVTQGHRSKEEQDAAFALGASKVEWPKSKHNSVPANAVDLVPYPIRWGNPGDPHRVKAIGNFYRLAGIVLATARELNIPVRWGGDWDMDGDVYDQDFDDLPHFELVDRRADP
jgi:peptidoglycan L-alanyl-D-glutamate endopeptidase CwlK